MSTATQPRSFNHRALRKVPEWEAVRRSIHDLARWLDEHDMPGGRAEFMDLVGDLARSVYAGDACDRCDSLVAWTPYRAVVDDCWMEGWYRCAECGAEWKCGYGALNMMDVAL